LPRIFPFFGRLSLETQFDLHCVGERESISFAYQAVKVLDWEYYARTAKGTVALCLDKLSYPHHLGKGPRCIPRRDASFGLELEPAASSLIQVSLRSPPWLLPLDARRETSVLPGIASCRPGTHAPDLEISHSTGTEPCRNVCRSERRMEP
jgi:hypothetical protein